MKDNARTVSRVAAVLLILSTALPVGSVIFLAATGQLAGTFAAPGDPSANLTVNRWTMRMANLSMLLAVFGFALLSARLWSAGESGLPTAALTGFIVAALGWFIEITVTFSMAEAAAHAVAQTGLVPDYPQPVAQWAHSLQWLYILPGLVATGLYGWGLLRTGIAPAWAGWATVGWAIVWIVPTALFVFTLPGVLLITPVIIGTGLLVSG